MEATLYQVVLTIDPSKGYAFNRLDKVRGFLSDKIAADASTAALDDLRPGQSAVIDGWRVKRI